MNQKAPWLIAYDVRDPRRLAHLHRFLRKRAVPVQYSVFTLRDSPSRVGMLANEIATYIHAQEDDVRIYRVPEPTHATVWGRCILPDDLMLVDVDSGFAIGTVPAAGAGGSKSGRRRKT